MTVEDLLKHYKIHSITELAKKIGASRASIYMWKVRGQVPEWWQYRILLRWKKGK